MSSTNSLLKCLLYAVKNGIPNIKALYPNASEFLKYIIENSIDQLMEDLPKKFKFDSIQSFVDLISPPNDKSIFYKIESDDYDIETDDLYFYCIFAGKEIKLNFTNNDTTYILSSFVVTENENYHVIFRNDNNFVNHLYQTLSPEELHVILKKRNIFAIYTCITSVEVSVNTLMPKKSNFQKKVVFNIQHNDEKLTDKVIQGNIYNRNELLLLLDEIAAHCNRVLYCDQNGNKRFKYICKYCEAKVVGRVKDDDILVTKVSDHTCAAKGYFPNKAKRAKDAFEIAMHKHKNLLTQEFITEDIFPYPKSTKYDMYNRIFEETSEKNELTWKKIPELLKKFENKDNTNTFLKMNGDSIEAFFILPIISINFMNSDLFIGFVITDGTFLKFFKIGRLIIFATYTGTHQILPLAYGYAPSESTQYIKTFLNIIKVNLKNEEIIKCFMSDEAGGIMEAERLVFPSASIKNCILHKSGNVSTPRRSLIYELSKSNTYEEAINKIQKYTTTYGGDLEKEINELLRWSRFGEVEVSQGMRTSGACETLNSVLKRKEASDILSYIQILYDCQYNTLLQMKSLCGDKYTLYMEKELSNLVNNSAVILTDIHKNIVHATEFINGKHYKYDVVSDGNKITCTCNLEKVYGFGCVHIYKACKSSIFEGDYEATISPAYRKTDIERFIQTNIPQYISFADLKAQETIQITEKPNKKLRQKRFLSAIDHMKRKYI